MRDERGWDELRHQRMEGRQLHRTRRPDDEDRGEKPSGGQPSERAGKRQHQGNKRLYALAEPQNKASIVTIGDLPDDERQRETGHELRQSD